MKRGRLPLTALRSFEAAGRLENFTLAAEELFVSQAAISRQIRGLEEEMGRPLFERQHRRVVLTSAGRALLDVLTACFDRMENALGATAAGEVRHLVHISVEPSFASGRLLAALPDFAENNPDIDVQMESDSRLIGFRGKGPVLAVRYSAGARSWPRVEARHLYDCEMAAVAAPELIGDNTIPDKPADLLRFPLVHEENRDLWARWFSTAGVHGSGFERGPIFDDASLVLQAAIRGQGIAIVDLAMARGELEAGRLVRLFDTVLLHGGYFLVARDFRRLPPAARILADWLAAEFGA